LGKWRGEVHCLKALGTVNRLGRTQEEAMSIFHKTLPGDKILTNISIGSLRNGLKDSVR
jgi:hypothetical protein